MPPHERFTVSPGGVQIAADFRDNLIIDRYDPVFLAMRASKRKHLRSANSEDAVSWNVFRSLRQIAPAHWLDHLGGRAFGDTRPTPAQHVGVSLWVTVAAPPSLVALGDEGESEIDIVLESSDWVWFIEAKYTSDIALGTTTRPDRDQLLRNIDVGSYFASPRKFYFSLLSLSDSRSPQGAARLLEYKDFGRVRALLHAHRPDGLVNLAGVGALYWSDLAQVLRAAATTATREDERDYAVRAHRWLLTKGIAAEQPGR